MATMVRERPGREEAAEKAARQININTVERVASLAGGGALALYGARRKDAPGAVLATLGGILVGRAASGYDPLYRALGVSTAGLTITRPISVKRAVTVNRSPEECYGFWRNFENLPRIMDYVESVTVLDGNRLRWRMRGPARRMIEWDSVIENDIPNQQISWRSGEGAPIRATGSVRFKPAPGGRGTEVYLETEFDFPGGNLGKSVARLFGADPEQLVRQNLRHFKQLVEAGEIPTTEGQPSGRRR